MTTLTPITAVIPEFSVTPQINTPGFPEEIDTYNTEQPAVIAAQKLANEQINVLLPQLNALELNVSSIEESALEASELAIGAANYQGEWAASRVVNGVTLNGYTLGQSVSIGTARFACKLTHATAQMPPNETYWLQIYGIDDTTPTLVAPYSGSKTQQLHDAQTQAIANLASASGSIANTDTPVFDPITTTPTDLPFTVTVPSTNSAVFTFDDTENTMTFLKDGVFNYTSPVTFAASTTDARVVTFDIVNTDIVTAGSFEVGVKYTIISVGTTDFTLIGASVNTVGVSFTATGVGTGTGTVNVILGSQLYDVEIAAGSTITIPANTLLTVGSNGIPSAPLTIKVMVSVDAGATVDLVSFTSTLVANSIVNEGAIAELIHASPTKATPIAGDIFSFLDSVAGAFSLVKLTYTQLKTALFASPAFTGVPTAPTASTGSNTTQLATTAYANAIAGGTTVPAKSLAASGYVKFANGLIFQWGVTGSLSDNTDTTVTLPVAFPTKCASVLTTFMNNRGNYEANVLSLSTTSFHILTHTTVASPVNWFAIGY